MFFCPLMVPYRIDPYRFCLFQNGGAGMSEQQVKTVPLSQVLEESKTKTVSILTSAAFYGAIPVALYVGSCASRLEWRDLITGLRLPLWS